MLLVRGTLVRRSRRSGKRGVYGPGGFPIEIPQVKEDSRKPKNNWSEDTKKCLEAEFAAMNAGLPTIREQAERAAVQLYSALSRKRKIMRKPSKAAWVAEFEKFLLNFQTPLDFKEFHKVFRWYLGHIGDRWVKHAYSAKAFCEYYVQIKEAMLRDIVAKEEESSGGPVPGLSQQQYLEKVRNPKIIGEEKAGSLPLDGSGGIDLEDSY